jgi:PrcB C-terminal
MRCTKWIHNLLSVGLIYTLAAIAGESKPDVFLVEYQAFRPNLYFGTNDGPDTPTYTAIQSEREWRSLWSEIEPRIARDMEQKGPHPFPPVDFTRRTLLVAALGTKPTGGYSVSIHSVVENPSRITVNVTELRPAKGCPVTLTSTHPIALVVIPRTSKPVGFSTTEAELICN